MKIALPGLALVLLFSLTYCKKKKCDDHFIAHGTAHSITGPDTVSIGENVDITVGYHTSESCQYFESFEEIKDGYNWKININIVNDPCDGCYMIAMPKSATYRFRADISGTYILDFGKNSLLDTIIVQ